MTSSADVRTTSRAYRAGVAWSKMDRTERTVALAIILFILACNLLAVITTWVDGADGTGPFGVDVVVIPLLIAAWFTTKEPS